MKEFVCPKCGKIFEYSESSFHNISAHTAMGRWEEHYDNCKKVV